MDYNDCILKGAIWVTVACITKELIGMTVVYLEDQCNIDSDRNQLETSDICHTWQPVEVSEKTRKIDNKLIAETKFENQFIWSCHQNF